MRTRTLLSLLIIALLMAGCSAKSTQSLNEIGSMPASDGVTMQYSEEVAAPMAVAEDKSGATGGGESASIERIVIKNASLTIVVADPTVSMDKISAMADEMGGYVVSSNLYKYTLESGIETPEASITIRVPAEKLNDALTQIKGQVSNPTEDVLNESVSGQDVTQEYTDLQSRLRNQEDAEAQLREIMASATTTEDVLNTFNQLTYVREQIEVLKGQIQYYEESAALSAISVTIKAEESVQPLAIGGWQPVGVARDAVQALLNALKFLVNVTIWLVLFFLPIALIIYLPIRLLWNAFRKMRQNRKAKNAVPPSAPTPPAAA